MALRLRSPWAGERQQLELERLVGLRRPIGRERSLRGSQFRRLRRRRRVPSSRRGRHGWRWRGRTMRRYGMRVAYRAAGRPQGRATRRTGAGGRRGSVAGAHGRPVPIGTRVGGIHARTPFLLAVVVPQVIVLRHRPIAAAGRGPAAGAAGGTTSPAAIVGLVREGPTGPDGGSQQQHGCASQKHELLHCMHSHCGNLARRGGHTQQASPKWKHDPPDLRVGYRSGNTGVCIQESMPRDWRCANATRGISSTFSHLSRGF